MQNPISSDRPREPRSWRRRIPTGLAGAAFWLGVWFVVLFVRRWIPGAFGNFLGIMQLFVGLALVAVAVPLIWQLIRKHMLWSLRNKLVLTYLLIGLAPVVLFVTLVGVVAYVAAGQFAIHLADSRLQAELAQMSVENEHRAERIAQDLERQSPGSVEASTGVIAESERSIALELPRMKLHREMQAFLNGVPVKFDSGLRGKTPFGLPPWATELNGDHYSGLVLDGSDLFLVAVQQQRWKDGRIFSLMSSLPVDGPVLTIVAEGLGHASLLPVRAGNSSNEAKEDNSVAQADQRSLAASGSKPNGTGSIAQEKDSKATRRSWIVGGTEPPSVNVADVPVSFTSTLPITDWDSGRPDSVFFAVESRPSLLYNQLFGASLSGIVTNVLRIAIVSLCVIFAIIELLALWMAIRLSRTITASVADLYSATQHIDRGDLDYRIGVQRNDQLAELSRSFNTMAGSLKRLLEEQKEKERLQNEISIAQEVQANLFPLHAQGLDTLELHGVCRPARSVSGDYYDFLVFHEEAHSGMVNRRETGVGIAIGDISGKGISAALLMATLHSAVRAYRFASEELVYSESSVAGLMASREARGGDFDELFQSPGRILSLLNRHLYRSTQPEKYATLFLSHYDAGSAMMTYSNAGQLPPLVLSRDGSIRRLDKGGTVVGLMDGMHYEEDRFKMQPGDIMVAYSDGVTEPENDFGEFGEERLMEVVARYRDQPLHVISSQVMQALDAWIGADEQPDDITLVLARQV
ncbi:PP2C family protein-serine/threonine phosphatase [Tunturiibacter lichenicola]|uniref:PP2C family protein-serine/threonine phosphatase n=1 Tax=Tunturiibacter lichenicola TaxID=2051959 RepID=UPI0021B45750|nr:PP2C family protein-serine/threonine phosphatase [Edaphobacter lichenicola]